MKFGGAAAWSSQHPTDEPDAGTARRHPQAIGNVSNRKDGILPLGLERARGRTQLEADVVADAADQSACVART